jgi:hypothetical protein
MTTSGYIEFMVVPHSDGTVEVFAPGQLPAGTIVVNLRIIRVSGPGLVAPPQGRQTAQQFQEFRARLQSQDYQVTDVLLL